MRTKFINLGRVLLVGCALALAACGSSGGSSGTGGSSGGGTGGATGTGGMSDAGSDATTGAGGANAHQNHLNIINATTTGGIPVSRTPPIDYASCKI